MAKNSDGWIRADEFQRILNEDPAYLAMMKEKTARREQLDAVLAEDERSLVGDLRYIGFSVDSVWDFVNSSEDYSVAIPVLLKHLDINHHPRITEGIARALVIPRADISVPRALIRAYQRIVANDQIEEGAKWALAYALGFTAGPEIEDELRTLLMDQGLGNSRSGLLRASCLLKSSKHKYEELLRILLFDACSEIVLGAIESIVKRKYRGCIPKLGDLSHHKDREIAKRAQWASKKLNRVNGKREPSK